MTMSDYSDLEQEIKDAPEPQALPKDTEVRLRIVRVDSGEVDKEEKKSYGARYYQVLFDVPAEPTCPMFNEFFWELADKDKIPPDQYARALPRFREFADCFGIDYSRPFSWEDELPGKEGDAVLKLIKDKEGEYPDKNGVKRFIVPK